MARVKKDLFGILALVLVMIRLVPAKVISSPALAAKSGDDDVQDPMTEEDKKVGQDQIVQRNNNNNDDPEKKKPRQEKQLVEVRRLQH